MNEISKIDFNFLRRLTSLYEALTISATDPVVVMNHVEFGKGETASVNMYYDAFGDGDIEELQIAETVMLRRIETGRDDILMHDRYNRLFLELFDNLDENMTFQ